jgi:hypothetical protein
MVKSRPASRAKVIALSGYGENGLIFADGSFMMEIHMMEVPV